MGESAFRWRLAGADDGQGSLFDADGLLDRHFGTGEFAGIEFLHVDAKRIINRVPASSRMPFRYTVNAYRGCSHACSYCFARPTHEYLGLDAGRDFETKIVVKINAVERLRAELADRRWSGEHVAMGTNTDPYQRCDGKYHLTRGIIRAFTDAGNPFSILTKSTLVLRDLDVLTEAAGRSLVRVALSIGTLDEEVWRLTEPGTPHPRQRINAVRRLNDAGVPCAVMVAPVIPGLSDSRGQVRQVAEAAARAGAPSVTTIGLHLRPGVRQHFMDWLAGARPDLLPTYQRLYGARGYLSRSAQQTLAAEARRAFAGGAEPARPAGEEPTDATPEPTDRRRPPSWRLLE